MRVIRSSSSRLAIPKSASTTRPSSHRNTFAGLTSRCTTPCAWAARRARTTASATVRTCSGGRRPRSRISASRPWPDISSITIHGRSSAVRTSCTRTIPGCRSRDAARASRTARSTSLPRRSAPTPSGSSSSLIATSRRITSSRAAHTTPIPPRPSSRTSR
ncbi:hypothetical protein BJF79_06750 [Actinomadura sp. CNU-125]|nr:hypothetical protein [Actinomadura sp. CNU-125]OLT36301.1 hypothetical protein BJF79_06750 [Actinomadura sp. CNU-125]